MAVSNIHGVLLGELCFGNGYYITLDPKRHGGGGSDGGVGSDWARKKTHPMETSGNGELLICLFVYHTCQIM